MREEKRMQKDLKKQAFVDVVFIRHGQTIWNEQGRYLGKTDLPLSEYGKEQVATWRENVPHTIDFLVTSPMLRCVETAQILYPQMEYRIVPEWSEIDFGDFEGKNYKELAKDLNYQKWIDSNGQLPFPNGESREAFILRSMEGWENVKKQILQMIECTCLDFGEKKERYTVVAVVHGGTIMSVCSTLLGGDYYDYQIKNGEQICITI